MSSLESTNRPAATLEAGTLADQLERGAKGDGTDARFAPLTARAFERAAELGLPAKTDEAWRYTDPAPVIETPCTIPEPGPFEGAASIDPLEIDTAAELVFIDGRFAPGLSRMPDAELNLRVEPIDADSAHDSYDSHDSQDRQHPLTELADRALADARDGFEALGASLLSQGLLIHAPEGVEIDRPVAVTFRSTVAGGSTLTTPTVYVIAERAASLHVVTDQQGEDGAQGLALGRTELRAATDARIEHTGIQRDPDTRRDVSTTRVIQQAKSFVRSNRLLLGGALTRNNIHATIEGDHCETALNGVFAPVGTQHTDTDIRIEHMAPDCHSRQFYRGVLADRGRGVFTGRIYVRDIAQKTDAIQSNSNLLLAPTAQVTSKPQLEIYADDVRCTHGSTTGLIDHDALFYLRSRGLTEKSARLLLLHAFAGECVDRIPHEPLRELVRDMIFRRLDAALERSA